MDNDVFPITSPTYTGQEIKIFQKYIADGGSDLDGVQKYCNASGNKKKEIFLSFIASLPHIEGYSIPTKRWMAREAIPFIADPDNLTRVWIYCNEDQDITDRIFSHAVNYCLWIEKLVTAVEDRITPEILTNILSRFNAKSSSDFKTLIGLAKVIKRFPPEIQQGYATSLFEVVFRFIGQCPRYYLDNIKDEIVKLLLILNGLFNIKDVITRSGRAKQAIYKVILSPDIATTVPSSVITEAVLYFSALVIVYPITIPYGFSLNQFSGKKLCLVVSFLSRLHLSPGNITDIPSVEKFNTETLVVQLGKNRSMYQQALNSLPVLETRNSQGETYCEKFTKLKKKQTPKQMLRRLWGADFDEVCKVFEFFDVKNCRDEKDAKELCDILLDVRA